MFRGHRGRQTGKLASGNVMQEMRMKPLARCQHFHITKNSIKQKLQFIFLPFAKKWTSTAAVFENISKRPQLVNLQLSANFHYKVVKTRRGSHSYGLSWTRYHEQGKKRACLKAAWCSALLWVSTRQLENVQLVCMHFHISLYWFCLIISFHWFWMQPCQLKYALNTC